ncbi:hypothetical protein [Pantoea agglomerans]|uniref:hypothetical protein n=1 Tax=Enterobacter agglomerans TaxID=549 RepID=UPI000DFEA529|nr:hypothetical protein [Pantoea agglomerans]SUC48984.1 Uncharacterised protein [Pantoea agglomerans]
MEKINTLNFGNEITELNNKQTAILIAASYVLRLAYAGLFVCVLGFVITMLGLHELWLYFFLKVINQFNSEAGAFKLLQALISLIISLMFPYLLLKATIKVFVESKDFGIVIKKNESGRNFKIKNGD